MKRERVLISFDYALKRLLRNKANYEVLEGFLSELLSKNVSVKNIGEGESNKENPNDKHNRVDILVEDESGEILLIELQFRHQIDFLHRMLFGTSKTISERIVQGEEYMQVKKVYSINIVYFDIGQGADYVYHGKTHFMGLHKNDELHLSSAQREIFGKETAADIYPEYYLLKVNSFDDVAKDTLDEWIYFLKHNVIKDEFKAKGMDKAREALKRDNLPPEEQKAYDYMMYQRSDDLSAIASSKLEGRIEGREEGREEGRIEREKLAEELEKERREREEREKEIEKEREERKEREKEIEKERAYFLAEITRLKQNGK
ncbi:MAG: Rpn family recombination-promoting nuclease/putative transposase [Prevotellaceae bacterium]|jgi:predicted transposase/invertase (TIGR01784 family)|nr:Rpn family recombination-promoting nuclease/putative transposase [Prevotellaceae bacterium]